MVRYTDDGGRTLCHRCMDRGRRNIAVAEVPARNPDYVYYLCIDHLCVWYQRRRRAERREKNRWRLISRRRAGRNPAGARRSVPRAGRQDGRRTS